MLAVFDVDAGVFLDRFMVCLKSKPRLYLNHLKITTLSNTLAWQRLKYLSKLV